MKFCVGCGQQLEDSVSFCPFCGSAQEEPVQKSTELMAPGQTMQTYPGYQGYQDQNFYMPEGQSYYPQQPKKDSFFSRIPKPVLIIVPIVAFVLIAAIVIIILVSSSRGANSYSEAVENLFEAYKSGESRNVVKVIFSSDMESQFNQAIEEGDLDDFDYDSLEEGIDDYLDGYIDSEVEYRKISVEDKEKYSKSEIRDIEKYFKKYCSVKVNITEAYDADVEYQYRDIGDKRWTDGEIGVFLFKTEDRWYCMPKALL